MLAISGYLFFQVITTDGKLRLDGSEEEPPPEIEIIPEEICMPNSYSEYEETLYPSYYYYPNILDNIIDRRL